jgi:hypothetical protein
MPGYMKDVMGWTENGPIQESYNKLATLPRSGYEILANKDYKGAPIREQDPHKWLQNYFDYVTNTFGPISVRGLEQGRKRGSNISSPESVMGLRPAPRYLTDPASYKTMMGKIGAKADKSKERSDTQQKALREK